MKLFFFLLLSTGFLQLHSQTTKTTIILFEFDKSAITDSCKGQLKNLVKELKTSAWANIELYGHCDSSGSSAYNDRLSIKRVEAVHQFLLSEGIIDSVIILNNDILLHGANYIKTLREEMFKGDFKLISPCILEPHTGDQTIWKTMRPWNTGTTREVPFIDYQAPMFSRELAEKLYPIPSKLIYGWGIDCLSAMVCEENNWKMGVCDKTPTIHLISQTLKLFSDELSDTNSMAEKNMFEYFNETGNINKFVEIRNKAFNYSI